MPFGVGQCDNTRGMAYDLVEHRHRFSVWAAARAAQRGLKGGKVEVLRDAQETIIAYLASRDVTASFGRAAKLIAIYLKSMVILNGTADMTQFRTVHPPIDGILLHSMCKATDLQSTYKKTWQKVKWTALSEDQYYSLIDQLRMCIARGEPFWTLERFWTVTDDQG